MACENISYDNRETCTTTLPSSCVPYTGYVSPIISPTLVCRPNVNDILKKLQEMVDAINVKLGDNTTLVNNCITYNAATATQKDINQATDDAICLINTTISDLSPEIDPNEVTVEIDLLCLADPACEPTTTYTLQAVLEKLVTEYCNLLNRIVTIETLLNI